jgi:hypothetical protein
MSAACNEDVLLNGFLVELSVVEVSSSFSVGCRFSFLSAARAGNLGQSRCESEAHAQTTKLLSIGQLNRTPGVRLSIGKLET